MSSIVVKLPDDPALETFLALIEGYPRDQLEAISLEVMAAEKAAAATEAVRAAPNPKARQVVKDQIKKGMTKTDKAAIVAAIKERKLPISKNFKRDENYELSFEIYRSVAFPTGAMEPDGFGNMRPVMETSPSIFVDLNNNGDKPLQDLADAAIEAGGTVLWRSDNTDGDPDELGNPTPSERPQVPGIDK